MDQCFLKTGNSGRPLLNMAGEVIGINTALFSETGGNVGIGFAIPINMTRDLLPQLRRGRVVRGWLKVAVQKITPELKSKLNLIDEKGALVSDVLPGDIIVEVDQVLVAGPEELKQRVERLAKGAIVLFLVDRGGSRIYITLRIS